nr:hypothetical protein BN993_01684 [Virgibacillus halodenitrificans]
MFLNSLETYLKRSVANAVMICMKKQTVMGIYVTNVIIQQDNYITNEAI